MAHLVGAPRAGVGPNGDIVGVSHDARERRLQQRADARAQPLSLDEREAAFAGAAGALTAFLGFPIAGAVFVHERVI